MARTLKVEIVGDASALQASLAKAAGSVDGFGARMSKVGGSIKSLGSSLTRDLTLPIVGIGAEAVKSSIDFQRSMELIHTQAGVSQKSVDALSKSVLALAGPTATAPEELSTGLYHLASQGLRGQKAMDALKIAAEGAKTGSANLEDVTNALGASLVSNIGGVQNLKSAMGALNATVGAGDMHMQDLAEAMGTGILATAKTFGLNITQIGGALATFGDNNIRGAKAATDLRSAIRLLGAPSKAAATELKGIGITSTQLADDMRSRGLIGALEDLKTHMKDAGLTASQQGVLLTRAFGGKQASGILVLLDQLDRLKTKTKEVADGAGTFSQDWAATTQTAAFKISSAWAQVKATLIQVGGILAPIVTKGAALLGRLASAFSNLSPHAQKLVLIFAGIAAAIGPALVIIGSIAGAIAVLATPLGAAVVGFAALAGVVGYFAASSPGFRAAIGSLLDDVKAKWPEIKQIATQVFSDTKTAINDLVTVGKALWSAFGSTLVAQARNTWDLIKGEVRGALDIIKGIIDVATGLIHGNWSQAWNGIKEIVDGVLTSIVAQVRYQLDTVVNVIRGVLGAARSAATALGHGIYTALIHALKALERLGSMLKHWIVDAIHSVVRAAVSAAKAVGKAIADGIVRGASGLAGSLAGKLKSGISSAIGSVKGLFGIHSPSTVTAEQIGKPLAEGIVQGAGTAIAPLSSVLSGGVRRAMDAAVSAIGAGKTRFGTAWGAFQSDVLSSFQSLASKVRTPAEQLLASLTGTHDAQQGLAQFAQAQSQLAAALTTAGQQGASPALLQKLADAQTKVGLAQDALNKALAKYGPESDQAAKATLALHSAQDALAKTQAQIPDQSNAVAQAFTNMQAAQQALTTAMQKYGAASKQAVAAQNQLQTATANAQIAVAGEDPNSPQAQNDQAVVDAQNNLNGILYQQQQTAIQAQATQQRAALNARIQEQAKSLNVALTNLKAHLEKTKASQKQAQDDIIKLLKSYDVSYQASGKNLGNAFAAGLKKAIPAVDAAAKSLASAAAQYLPHSPAEKGPLSRLPNWQGYLLAGLDGAASAVGGAMGGLSRPGVGIGAARAGGGSVNVYVSGSLIGSSPQQLGRELGNIVEPYITRRRVSLGA